MTPAVVDDPDPVDKQPGEGYILSMTIELKKEVQKELIASIKRYFGENLDDEIGDLKASLLLEYILAEIGPSIYNQSIEDAQAYFQDKVADLENTCWEEELTYWQK